MTKPLKQFTSCDSLRTGGWVMREWKRRWNFIGAGCAHIFCLCLHLQVNFRSNVLQRGENETFGLTQILLHVYQLNINFSLLILSAYFSDVLGSLLSLCRFPWLIGLVYIQKISLQMQQRSAHWFSYISLEWALCIEILCWHFPLVEWLYYHFWTNIHGCRSKNSADFATHLKWLQ